MTGWDTPSRPTWDPQDGPDDGTQAFSVPDTSAGDDDTWATPAGPGWGASPQSGSTDFGAPGAGDAFSGPPPEFFKPEFERRTPGASLGRSADKPSWNLSARDEAGRGRDGGGRGGNGRGANGAGAHDPAWDEPQWQDTPRQDFGRQDEYGGPDLARQDFGGQDFGGQEFGPQDPADQDFPHREPGRTYYDAQPDYAAQMEFAAQMDQAAHLDQAGHGLPTPARLEQERSARMDPALQDFFAPAGPGFTPRPGQGPRGPAGSRPSGGSAG